MNYEQFLITLSDATPEQAFYILCTNLDHEHKKAYELIISKNACCSYLYAYEVIRGRFESGEDAISKDAYCSYYYATIVIRDRFELGEKVIRNSVYKNDYAKYIMNDPNFWETR